MFRPYQRTGLVLAEGPANDPTLVKELQRDLRALGYLPSVIDGQFGPQTARAIRALQCDLLFNDGTGSDGSAGLAVASFNNDGQGGKLVGRVTGVLDQRSAMCLGALIDAPSIAKLPFASDPVVENKRALEAIATTSSTTAPTPFIAAMILQESGGRHYHVPGAGDEDGFVTVGLDRNDANNPDRVTSRGYGVGQYTIFHHPARVDEVADFIADPVRNVKRAYRELSEKFNSSVVGPSSRADDRTAEHPLLPLRVCRYRPSDRRYMRDCKNCAAETRKLDIVRGTPAYAGASITYQPTQYYASAIYNGVPDRAEFLCDWPYAARRYNGGGVNSYHYQTRILLNLLR